jgi:hypothetical protein
LRFDFLDRLYDRRSVSERYAAGHVNLHLHGKLPGNGMWCYTFLAQTSTEVLLKTGMDMEGGLSPGLNKMPVFVRIGAVTEPSRPVASTVRLQPLNCCHMSDIDALEPTPLNASLKSIFMVFNRKLSVVLRRAGIELGEFENEIIKGSSEVVTNFADKHAEPHVVKSLFGQTPANAVRGIRIELNGDSICLSREHEIDPPFEISKVFVCPSYSFEAAIERIKEIIDHCGISNDQ